MITPALLLLFKPAAWGIAALFVVKLLKMPWVRGYVGELLVRSQARRGLPEALYQRLHNVTLRTPDGTTQIDHIFLSRYGVFVVETKHMSGWIFGGERQAQWTQKLYRKTWRFQNPLRQNYKHGKALESTLGIAAQHLHSVVVFSGNAVFKTPLPANVTRGRDFVGYIKGFREPVFSQAEVDALCRELQRQRLPATWATSRAHVAHLRARK